MSTKKYHDLNAVAAYMHFDEFAWEYADMMLEEKPDDKAMENAVFQALEDAGITVDDKPKLLKSLSYYHTDGYEDIEGEEGFNLDVPDYETIFSKLEIC